MTLPSLGPAVLVPAFGHISFETLVIPDLIRDPFRGEALRSVHPRHRLRPDGSRIKSGMTEEKERRPEYLSVMRFRWDDENGWDDKKNRDHAQRRTS